MILRINPGRLHLTSRGSRQNCKHKERNVQRNITRVFSRAEKHIFKWKSSAAGTDTFFKVIYIDILL